MEDSHGDSGTNALPLGYRLLAAALSGLGLRPSMRLPAVRVQHGMLGLLFVLLAGCSPLAEKLGLRVRLDAVSVTTVSAHLTERDQSVVSALGPGQSAQLVIVASDRDGKQWTTVGAGRGKVAFDNYAITADVVQLSHDGKVSMPADPHASEGRVGHLRIAPLGNPAVVAELDIPPRYDLGFVADFSGADGRNGADGIPGSDGIAGVDAAPATVDPVTGLLGARAPGGAGSSGGNGGTGYDGRDGMPGGEVQVWVKRAPGAPTRLRIKVVGSTKTLFFLVDPDGGSLRILANGGRGGRGGSGGRGGHGGAGGDGFPPGPGGADGIAGFDGRPGANAAAGTLTVSVDPDAQPYLACLNFTNRDGAGVAGPAPFIKVESVADAW